MRQQQYARSVTTKEVVSTLALLALAIAWTLSLAHSQESINIQVPRSPLFDRIHAALPELAEQPPPPRCEEAAHCSPGS